MTTEFWLFLIVGAIAVVSAMFMLLSDNAVHSALFLILVMGCIAFMFLMLNAPFLAMVQITVYAGAIMVLFLFVIMLLGAERLVSTTPFRWMTPGAIVLSLLFLGAVALALGAGPISSFTPPPADPQLRVAHFASDIGPVDLYVDGELAAEDLKFGDSIGYLSIPAGDHEFSLNTQGSDTALVTQSVSLEQGFVGTAVAYGTGEQPALGISADDLTSTDERSGRISFFNAYSGLPVVSLVDFGNDFDPDDTQILLSNVAEGMRSESVEFPEGADLRTWAIVEAGNDSNVLARLASDEVFGIERGKSTLLVLGAERTFTDTVRPLVVPLVAAAAPAFGSPADVGQVLFTRYMLPMQAVAVLLLVAMVGAIVLTHKPSPSAVLARARMGRRRVSRPLTSVISAQVGHEVTQPSTTPELPEPAEEGAGD